MAVNQGVRDQPLDGMKKEDFLSAMRKFGSRFRVDDISIETGTGTLSGRGFIETEKDNFRLNVILSDSALKPPSPVGYVSQREFWKITGLVEDEIHVTLRAFPSGHTRHHRFGREQSLTLRFSSNLLDVTPSGLDRLTTREKREMQTQKPEPATEGPVSICFLAILPRFKLLDMNGGTITESKNDFLGESSHTANDTFSGELGDWNFGLIQRDEDLHIHFNSKEEYRSTSDTDDLRLFRAFLNAVAFAHGQHAWPVSLYHWCDGRLLLHRLQLHGEVARTPHSPFGQALAHGQKVDGQEWKFHAALERAHSFFAQQTRLATECSNLQFLLREASASGVPQRISLLSLCSLLESLVRAVYEEKIAPEEISEVQDFVKAKSEVLEELKRQGRPKRLITILANADPVNNRIRFQTVLGKLGLTGHPFWDDLYGFWSQFRNPLSHRMSSDENSESASKDETFAESRLAGAINCIVLKLMGYSGPVRLSAFEDEHIRI